MENFTEYEYRIYSFLANCDTGQRLPLVHMVRHSEEEPEILQPEMSAGSRSLTEEGTGEIDISDREDSIETAESGPHQTRQGELGKESPQTTGNPRNWQQDLQSAERKVRKIGQVLATQRRAG